MPTYRKYKYIILSSILLLAPIILPFVVTLPNFKNNNEVLPFIFLWVASFLLSIIFAIKSFKNNLAKIFSVLVIFCDILLVGWFLFTIWVAYQI